MGKRSRAAKGISQAQAQTFGVVLAAAAAVTLILSGALGGMMRLSEAPAFAAGTVINGINISALRYEEGCTRVLAQEQSMLAGISLRIRHNGGEATFDAKSLGIGTNAQELLDTAYQRNKSGAFASDFDEALTPVAAQADIVIDDALLEKTIVAFLKAHDLPARDAAAAFDTLSRTFSYLPEQAGSVADVDAVLALIKERILAQDYSPITLAGDLIEKPQPALTAKALRQNTASIGHSVTIASDHENRNVNIQLMCKAIDGFVLEPGETLSLNALVGKRTAEKGFLAAPSIIDGQLVDDLGGGICQLAGTLYNAALLAGMEIVERVHHTWPSEYLPIGLDATLNWDNKDLKIKNNSEYPMYIAAKLENLYVDVEIFGAPLEDGMEIDVENVIVKEVAAPEPEIIYTDKLAAGVTRVKTRSHKGYEVKVYRHYLRDGEIITSELISHDHFRAMRGSVLMGTNEIIK